MKLRGEYLLLEMNWKENDCMIELECGKSILYQKIASYTNKKVKVDSSTDKEPMEILMGRVIEKKIQ